MFVYEKGDALTLTPHQKGWPENCLIMLCHAIWLRGEDIFSNVSDKRTPVVSIRTIFKANVRIDSYKLK